MLEVRDPSYRCNSKSAYELHRVQTSSISPMSQTTEKSQQRKGVDFTTAFENYNVLSKNGAHKRSSGAKPHLGSGKRDEVTIHVCDEGRQTSKYFFCQRSLLIAVSDFALIKYISTSTID